MSQHLIEYVARDRTGITAVVTPTGVVDAAVVIANIRSGHSCYYVSADSWMRVPVRILSVLGGAYLFANWDGSKRNNLHDLAFRTPPRPVEPAKPRGDASFSSVMSAVVAALFGRDRNAPR